MIRQAIEFDEIAASEIFTPRVDVAAISQTATVGEIDSTFAETGFSRLPVSKDNIDNITGVILLKDFHHLVMNRLKAPPEIVKPVVFVTKTIKIAKLLRTLQQRQSHLAVVVDEFGGTLGIVTIEDIVEELVGEIWDEHDEVVQPVKKLNDSSFAVMGSVNFKDMLEYIAAGTMPVNAKMREEVPETTVGNWIMEKMGGVPRRGDEFFWGNVKLRVSAVVRQRVMEAIVSVEAGGEHGKE
jgi:CBS domain containing-hemolysin-like protein